MSKQTKYSMEQLSNKIGYYCIYWEGHLEDMALYYIEEDAKFILSDKSVWPSIISMEELRDLDWGDRTYAVECQNPDELKAKYL